MKAEIFLFLHDGVRPKRIIKMGYAYATVYKYHRIYKKSLEVYEKKKNSMKFCL